VRIAIIGIAVLAALTFMGCNKSANKRSEPMNDAELQAYLATQLKAGDTKQFIEQFLQKHHWKYEFNEFESQYVVRYESGDVNRELEKSGVVILISVNEAGALSKISTHRVFTGL
jgi:hypothetical protein